MKSYVFFIILMVIPFLLNANCFFDGQNGLQFNSERNGRIQQTTTEMSTNGVWALINRTQYFYNPTYATQIDSIAGSYRSEDSWRSDKTTILTYDNSHQYVISAVYRKYNNENADLGEASFVYDEQNRLRHVSISQMQNSVNPLIFRYHFSYNGQQLSEIASMMFYFGTTSYSVRTFTTDERGRISIGVTKVSQDSTNWVNSDRLAYTYQASDITTGASLIEYIAKYYPVYSFTGGEMYFGKLATDITSIYTNDSWVESDRNTYTYNGLNLLISKLNEKDSNGSGIWASFGQNLYTNDANSNLAVDIAQNYNQVTGWSDDTRITYVWDNTTSIDTPIASPIQGLSLQISPNPFSNNVTFQSRTLDKKPIQISIYNLKGQLVHKESTTPGTTIRWDGKNQKSNKIATGIYFVKAIQGNITRSYKILYIQ